MTVLVILSLTIGGVAPAQDAAEKNIVTISGSATLPGVMMKGLPGNPVTDASGHYSVTVNRDWNGTVVPTKEGYNFNPKFKVYHTIVSDMIDENYVAELMSFRISGGVATEGVMMKGLPGIPISGKDGKYNANVPYGWSGTVIPVKAGYTFDPPRLQ